MREEIKAKENKVAGGGPEHWQVKSIGKNPRIKGADYALVDTSTGKWIAYGPVACEPGVYEICGTKEELENRKLVWSKYPYMEVPSPDPDHYFHWTPPKDYYNSDGSISDN